MDCYKLARVRDEPEAPPAAKSPALPTGSASEPLDLPDEGWPMQRDRPLIPLYDDDKEELTS